MKFILLLIFASTALSSMQNRSSILTDESKKLLNIFDFSNRDKRELSYIETERFENPTRGKRNNRNQSYNMLNSNFNSGDLEDYGTGRKKYDSKNGKIDKYCGGSLSNDEKLKLNSRNNRELDLESIRLRTVKRGSRRARSPKSFENTNDIERNGFKSHEEENGNNTNEANSHDKNDIEDDAGGNFDGYEKGSRKRRKKKRRHHWSKWTEWSSCSVTCGKGRKIRSRKCIAKSCPSGEIEMGEKTCQLPACSLFDKFFSFLT